MLRNIPHPSLFSASRRLGWCLVLHLSDCLFAVLQPVKVALPAERSLTLKFVLWGRPSSFEKRFLLRKVAASVHQGVGKVEVGLHFLTLDDSGMGICIWE